MQESVWPGYPRHSILDRFLLHWQELLCQKLTSRDQCLTQRAWERLPLALGMPGGQGHPKDPVRLVESPRDAGELLCFLPAGSPWSTDCRGTLLVRAMSFSPAATERSRDSSWIWLQSPSSLCRARTNNYLWPFGSGCIRCGVCLYSSTTLYRHGNIWEHTASQFHPVPQQPHGEALTGCPSSER